MIRIKALWAQTILLFRNVCQPDFLLARLISIDFYSKKPRLKMTFSMFEAALGALGSL